MPEAKMLGRATCVFALTIDEFPERVSLANGKAFRRGLNPHELKQRLQRLEYLSGVIVQKRSKNFRD